ncbi:hypothetical protein ACFLW0_04795 [Chloroflexota bacterium]
MRNKWIKRLFPLIALLLLAPWPVAYAYTFDGGTTGQDGVQIKAAEASAAPSMTVFGKAISGVTPGDLFYIDATDNPADVVATLYLTNAQELIGCYRNLILKVGIYTASAGGEWEKASTGNGEPIPDTFIMMRNGQVSFTLAGLAKYKITIDSGSFYCTTANTDKGSLSPQFYLEVD